MEDPRENYQTGAFWKWGFAAAMVALFVVAGVSMTYLSRGRTKMDDVAAANQALNSSVTQLKAQLRSVTEQLNERPGAPAPAVAAAPRASAAPQRARVRPAPQVDPRVTQLQSKLADQERALNSTRDDLNKTRED